MAKVALLYESLGRSRGGIEAWIYHASEELVSQGHEVTIYHMQASIPGDAAPEKVKIISLKEPKAVPGFYFLKIACSLKYQLRRELQQYDAIWARSFTMAWAASKIAGRGKVLYINAAPQSYYGRKPFSANLKKYPGFKGFIRALSIELYYDISWLIERRAIRRCPNAYLSKSRKDQTTAHFRINLKPYEFIIVSAGVNARQFYPSPEKWNGLEKMRLITVCRLAPDKNIQCIIDAVSKLVAEKVPVHLTIVGEGPFEPELRKQVRDLKVDPYIDFAGRQENIGVWYRQNHLFVLPSLYEGFGSVYIEAMASGLPCIALSSCNGKYPVAADEIIDHGINGLLMKENDSLELAALIRGVIRDPQSYGFMSQKARDKAVEEFAWRGVIEKLLSFQMIN
ncbi:MAG: glycosyltransferase family 4 protein [Bacteroidota bacterium]